MNILRTTTRFRAFASLHTAYTFPISSHQKKFCHPQISSHTTTLFRNMTTEQQWTVESAIPDEIKDILTQQCADQPSNYVLAFLQIVSLLKLQRRTGWVDHGITPCESIADHMYRMAVTAMLIKDKSVDTSKCTKIAIIHDIAEAIVGDITPFDVVGKDEKHRRELETIKYLSELVKKYDKERGQEILECWLDYEEIRTLEARYVKDIDKFELLLQCYEYEKKYQGEKRLDQFWSARAAVKTEEVNGWVADLWEKRCALFESFEKK